jgi:hypothetical protein
MRAALAGLDEGTFTEGHELDRKTTKQVPKAMIGRRWSQDEQRGCWLSLNEETSSKDCLESPLVGATATMRSRRIQF